MKTLPRAVTALAVALLLPPFARADFWGDLVNSVREGGGAISERWREEVLRSPLWEDAKKLFKETKNLMDGQDNDTVEGADVILYEHDDGAGKARGLRVGDACLELRRIHHMRRDGNPLQAWPNWHDKVCSVRVLRPGVRIRLFENENFGGREVVLDKPGMYNMRPLSFNDAADSAVVESVK